MDLNCYKKMQFDVKRGRNKKPNTNNITPQTTVHEILRRCPPPTTDVVFGGAHNTH
ncbi:hypothetical protein HanIR_Chr12g0589521 [Helianthus annuus]|nr:hypothetical protein HanIR_Chr12g0589521 [Helianthus annuus]